MAIYGVKNKTVLNEYLTDTITLGVNEILNYGDDDSALRFMIKKHHNLIDNVKKNYGVQANIKYKYVKPTYLEKSRDPETPVYVSYTPYDLFKISGLTAGNEAIYYLKGINQAIGIMTFSKLQDDEQ